MNRSDNINELASALAKAQGEMRPAVRDGENPHYKSKFASLPSVAEACRGPLAANGLAVTQTMKIESGKTYLVTTLFHESGQWIESVVPVEADCKNPQALGSLVTYLRRYCLSAIVGVVSEDDDGEMVAAAARDARVRDARPAPRRPEPTRVRGGDDDAEFRKYVDRAMIKWGQVDPLDPSETVRARELRLANHVATEAIGAGKVAEAALWKPGTQSRSSTAAWEALNYLHREHRAWLLEVTRAYLQQKADSAAKPGAPADSVAAAAGEG